MQDHYEILQVHPKADQEAIQAAYERMRQRYNPTQFEGAADELAEIARQRRDDIERAYAVLGDPVRRNEYDAEQQALTGDPAASGAGERDGGIGYEQPGDDGMLDYRPLPPAQRQERPRNFNPQPVAKPPRTQRQSGRKPRSRLPFWVQPAAIVGVTTFLVISVSFLSTNGGRPEAAPAEDAAGPAVMSTTNPLDDEQNNQQLVNQFEGQIVAARQVTERVPANANAWINLGNTLYDSVQVVREHMPESDLYQERLPRWIEASEAYRQALELEPDNAALQADLAASLCKYGEGTSEQSYVEEGLAEAQQAIAAAPDNPRTLLHLGVCLVSSEPPQIDSALEHWLEVIDSPTASEGEQFEARQLIQEYTQ